MSTAYAIPSSRPHLYSVTAKAIRPKPVLTVSQWSDSNRILSSKGSSESGAWNTDRTPYLREIMDALSATSPVQRIAIQKSAQVGATEAALNWIGYVMDHAPAPMLVVTPTLEVRKRWVRQRLDPMLEETPVLAKIINARSKRDAGNSEDMKDFPGGILVVGGANSPASLASMPIRYVLCDEVDRFPWEVGDEGDPLGLIDERTKTFPRRKVLLVSTPTVKGESRIEQEYESSDQREYWVTCPHCHTRQPLHPLSATGELNLVLMPGTGEACYPCHECGTLIEEHHKPKMLAEGIWIPKNPGVSTRGYYLNALYSPIALGFSWSEIRREWLIAKNDTSKLKRFVNTTLGLPFEQHSEHLDDLVLITRPAPVPEPLPAFIIVAGVDVQKDRIELTVVAFGQFENCWALDHIILPGDTADATVWDDLTETCHQMGVKLATIDSGYNTGMVYDYCSKNPWAIAIKGVTGNGRPLVEDDRKRAHRLRQRRNRGITVEPIGVDQGKSLIYLRIREQEKHGAIHWADSPAFDEEYFAQIAAEKLETKIKGGRPTQIWVQKRPRNEALDCLIYALAACRLSKVDLTQPFETQTKPQTKPQPKSKPAKYRNWRQ